MTVEEFKSRVIRDIKESGWGRVTYKDSFVRVNKEAFDQLIHEGLVTKTIVRWFTQTYSLTEKGWSKDD